MKKTFIFILLLVTALSACKKNEDRREVPSFGPPTAIEWTAITGDPGKPGESLLFTSDGNVLVSGSREGSVLLFKADTACRIIWEIEEYAGAPGSALKSLELKDGAYVTLVSIARGEKQADFTYLLYFVSSAGSVTDSFPVDPKTMNYIADMEVAPDGGIILAGSRIPPGKDLLYSNRWSVLKVTRDGDSFWEKKYTDEKEILLTDLSRNPAGELFLSAYDAYDDRVIIIYRIQADGDILNRKEFTSDYNISAGFDMNSTSILAGYNPFEPDGQAYLASFDLSGHLLWHHHYEVNTYDSSYNPLLHIHPVESGFIAFGSAIYVNSLANVMSDMTAWISVFDQSENLDWHVVWTPDDEDRPCNFMINSVVPVGDNKCILLGEGILDYPCADENEIFIIPVNENGFIYPTSPASELQ